MIAAWQFHHVSPVVVCVCAISGIQEACKERTGTQDGRAKNTSINSMSAQHIMAIKPMEKI
jgi:hypothetical protein